jgi:hypothetical protein
MPAGNWSTGKTISEFPDRRTKASQCSSLSIPGPIMHSTFKIFRCQSRISDIALSSANQPLINRAMPSMISCSQWRANPGNEPCSLRVGPRIKGSGQTAIVDTAGGSRLFGSGPTTDIANLLHVRLRGAEFNDGDQSNQNEDGQHSGLRDREGWFGLHRSQGIESRNLPEALHD